MYTIAPGTTDVTIYVRLKDSSTGLSKTGLTHSSAGASAYYIRPLGPAISIPLVAQTVDGVHLDGGFVEVDGTNAKGVYRLDLPDAACAVSPSMPYVSVCVEFDGVDEEFSIVELIDTPSGVWSNSTRTLTQSAASVATTVSGSVVTVARGDTVSVSLTGLGDISARAKMWFTVKRGVNDLDASSIIQIEETDGLLYFLGDVGTAINGSLAVTNEVTGAITISLVGSDSASLAPSRYFYDIQVLYSDDSISTISSGYFVVTADITRRVA